MLAADIVLQESVCYVQMSGNEVVVAWKTKSTLCFNFSCLKRGLWPVLEPLVVITTELPSNVYR